MLVVRLFIDRGRKVANLPCVRRVADVVNPRVRASPVVVVDVDVIAPFRRQLLHSRVILRWLAIVAMFR